MARAPGRPRRPRGALHGGRGDAGRRRRRPARSTAPSRRRPAPTGLVVRRWDGQVVGAATARPAAFRGDDLGVRFSAAAGTYLAGDWWGARLREAEGDGIEHRTDAPPDGVRHAFAPLALVDLDGPDRARRLPPDLPQPRRPRSRGSVHRRRRAPATTCRRRSTRCRPRAASCASPRGSTRSTPPLWSRGACAWSSAARAPRRCCARSAGRRRWSWTAVARSRSATCAPRAARPARRPAAPISTARSPSSRRATWGWPTAS